MSDELKSLLQRHDPAAGKALTEFDRTRMLQRARSGAPALLPARFAAAFGILIVVIVASLFIVRHQRELTKPVPTAAVRQIHYATPGGTRIIWTLDPNFHM